MHGSQFHTRADLPKAVSLRSMPVRLYAVTPSLAERPHRALRTGVRGRERSARLQGQAHEVHSGAHSVDPRCHQGRTRCELSERACRWDRSYPPTAGESRLRDFRHHALCAGGSPDKSTACRCTPWQTWRRRPSNLSSRSPSRRSRWEASAALLPST